MTPGHDLYLALQELWLYEVAGPDLIFAINILVGVLSGVAAGASLKNALRDIETEATWTPGDCRRYRIINWTRVVGLILVALAFLAAAFFEQGRLTSPIRLVVPRLALCVFLLGSYWDALFWRAHYKRKRILREVKQEVEAKR